MTGVFVPSRDAANEIVKHLSRIEWSGTSGHRLFCDWLDIVENTLDQLPNHLRSMRETGQMAEDPAEVQEIWKQLRSRYPDPKHWENFRAAFQVLIGSVSDGWFDTLGCVFMDYANPNGHNGQYFTPWNVARCMAEMTVGEQDSTLQAHLRAAKDRLLAEGSELDKALFTAATLAGVVLEEQNSVDYFMSRVFPIIAPYYEPVTVCDPCCGSGVMLLAAASVFPAYAVQFGLVQFYGMDIDQTCVQMARINCKLYGLNGHHLAWIFEMDAEQLEVIPSPYREIYQEAVEHQDEPEVIAVCLEKLGRPVQLSFLESLA